MDDNKTLKQEIIASRDLINEVVLETILEALGAYELEFTTDADTQALRKMLFSIAMKAHEAHYILKKAEVNYMSDLENPILARDLSRLCHISEQIGIR